MACVARAWGPDTVLLSNGERTMTVACHYCNDLVDEDKPRSGLVIKHELEDSLPMAKIAICIECLQRRLATANLYL